MRGGGGGEGSEKQLNFEQLRSSCIRPNLYFRRQTRR